MAGYPRNRVPERNAPGQNQPGGRAKRDEVIIRLAIIRWWRKRVMNYVERIEEQMRYAETNQEFSASIGARPSFEKRRQED